MIACFDYRRGLSEIESEVVDAVKRVLHSGTLMLGPETEAFEQEFAAWLGVPQCIGVASGTTALHLALWALGMGPGDEVITVANTCPPTIAAICLSGATPVFVDVHPSTLMMNLDALERAISDRTRCVLPVHLWGHMVDMDRLGDLAKRHGLYIVEDCAQAVGASWNGRAAGTWGICACFSFYPTKNLGAYGDAGAVVTSDPKLAERLRRMRMYGYDPPGISEEEGMNARIHEMQAAILRVKLRVLDDWLDRRRACAALYDSLIEEGAIHPVIRDGACQHAFHQYVVRCSGRDALASALRAQGIGSGIHYAVPVHEMPAYRRFAPAEDALENTIRGCREILSLPLHESLAQEEIEHVAQALNTFQATT